MSTTPPELPAEVIQEFNTILQAALDAKVIEPTAMTIASHENGRVSARTVLMKAFDARGFVFYTNLKSNKGRQLLSHPEAALTFLWRDIERQVLVEGVTEQVSDEEADTYFASRHRASQIGAWASQQSQPLASRESFDSSVSEFEQRFDEQPIPRPPYWSGFRIRPTMIEFWYGRQFRLHDRFRWALNKDNRWQSQRLYP